MPSFERGYAEELTVIYNSRLHEEQDKSAKTSLEARGIADSASNSSKVALEQLNAMNAENIRSQRQRLADAIKKFESLQIYETRDDIVNRDENHLERAERHRDNDKKSQDDDNRRQDDDKRRREDEKKRKEDEKKRQETEKRRRER
jgi:hypothetical protein